jgi:glutathione S-transferase
MELLYTPFSPFARKVRVVAHEKRLSEQIELVLTEVGTHVPLCTPVHDQLAAVTPLLKVPVLIDGAERLYDSRVICEYLDGLSDGPRMFPEPGPRRWRALRRQATADGIMDAAILCRFEQARPVERTWDEWLSAQTRRILLALDTLDRAPPTADEFDIGAVSVACALGYLDFRFGYLGWRAGRISLARWFDALRSRASMQETNPGPSLPLTSPSSSKGAAAARRRTTSRG